MGGCVNYKTINKKREHMIRMNATAVETKVFRNGGKEGLVLIADDDQDERWIIILCERIVFPSLHKILGESKLYFINAKFPKGRSQSFWYTKLQEHLDIAEHSDLLKNMSMNKQS